MSTRTEQLAIDTADVDRALGGRLFALLQHHPGTVDPVVATICLVVQVLVLIIALQRPLWPLLACTLVSSALLLWRRKFPMGMVVVIAVIGTIAAASPVPSPAVMTIPAAGLVRRLTARHLSESPFVVSPVRLDGLV